MLNFLLSAVKNNYDFLPSFHEQYRFTIITNNAEVPASFLSPTRQIYNLLYHQEY
jgi:hypothetical protein